MQCNARRTLNSALALFCIFISYISYTGGKLSNKFTKGTWCCRTEDNKTIIGRENNRMPPISCAFVYWNKPFEEHCITEFHKADFPSALFSVGENIKIGLFSEVSSPIN